MRRAERVRAWRQRRLATHGNGTLLVDAGANAFGPGLVYNADSTVASRALFRALGYDAFAVSAPDFEAGAGAGQPGGGEDRPVPGDEYVAAHVAALAPAQAVVSNLDRASSVHLGSSRIRPYSLHAVGGGHSVALLSCMHEHTPLAPATTASVAYTLQLCRAGLISATESILSETERVGKQRPVFAVIINGMESAGNTTQLFVEQIAHELLSIDMVLINSDTAPWLGAGSATTITNYAGKPVLLASLGSNALGHRLYDVAVRFAAPGSGGAPVLSGYAITKDELDCTVAVSDAAGAQTRPHIDVLRAGLQDWLAERVGNVVDTAALQSAEDCAEQGSTCATGIVVADAAAAAAAAAVAAADGNGNTGTVVSLVPSKLVLNSLLPSSSQSGDDPSVERVAAAATTTTMTTPTTTTTTATTSTTTTTTLEIVSITFALDFNTADLGLLDTVLRRQLATEGVADAATVIARGGGCLALCTLAPSLSTRSPFVVLRPLPVLTACLLWCVDFVFTPAAARCPSRTAKAPSSRTLPPTQRRPV